MQGLMWRDYDAMGFLKYSFVETVMEMHPFYIIRALGGALYLGSALIMVYNFYRTIKGDFNEQEFIADGVPRETSYLKGVTA